MKVAIVYDRVNKWGGAERVLLVLHELFPQAPLYTSVYNPKRAQWADVFQVKSSFLQKVPFVRDMHEMFALFMPSAFEEMNFDGYDLVISVTSEAAKGIRVGPKTTHICYCLTPTRYLWSGHHEYFRGWLGQVAKPLVSYLQDWDRKASKRPYAYIAISKEVQKRIKKYYKRDSAIVYPPVTFSVKKAKLPRQKNYFLVVSRLVSYKRIDLAIQACNNLKLPLKIVGTGSQIKHLMQIAGPTIEFVGSLTEEKLVGYYKNCKALLFPGKEDFGLVVVEAALFGKPTIAFAQGGAAETIIDGKTGVFFNEQTTEAVEQAILRFEKKRFKKEDCIKQAKKFSQAQFKVQFRRQIEEILRKRRRKNI